MITLDNQYDKLFHDNVVSLILGLDMGLHTDVDLNTERENIRALVNELVRVFILEA
ncbi:MAG: hypothetical protein K2X77_13445 [Candidatus Obscuribacterales bacterium]|nr:hypothetical protein [Candidatus Obscuribacterales bacterium]